MCLSNSPWAARDCLDWSWNRPPDEFSWNLVNNKSPGSNLKCLLLLRKMESVHWLNLGGKK